MLHSKPEICKVPREKWTQHSQLYPLCLCGFLCKSHLLPPHYPVFQSVWSSKHLAQPLSLSQPHTLWASAGKKSFSVAFLAHPMTYTSTGLTGLLENRTPHKNILQPIQKRNKRNHQCVLMIPLPNSHTWTPSLGDNIKTIAFNSLNSSPLECPLLHH